MGAALTYARRYALFSLVGIAGELLGRSGGVFVLSREPNPLEVLDRRKPQERKRAASLSPAGRLANLLGQARLPSAIKLRVGFASV
jgi:hypothetical protein